MRYYSWAEKNLKISRQSGNDLLCNCPLHDDRTPSFSFNVSTGLWICFGCGQKGNAEQLAARLRVGLSATRTPPETLVRLSRATRRMRGSNLPIVDERVLERFTQHPYWSGRGLSDKTIIRFSLGFDPRIDMVTIPTRNSYGELNGIIYRRIDNRTPKYIYPTGFEKNKTLYASWAVRKSEEETIALVEGPVDALSLWDIGIPAIAILGSRISLGQIKLLQSLVVRTVVVMTDNDDAGKTASSQVTMALKHTGIQTKRALYLHEYKDPAEVPPDERKEMFAKCLQQGRNVQ